MNGAVHPVDGVRGSYVDFILLLENEVKAVSSSEAHARVLGSPLISGRRDRVMERMERVKVFLRGSDLGALSGLVLEEALDMHELFHTSLEPFSYWNAKTRMWLDRLSPSRDSGLPGIPLVTLDAGANLHVFVESAKADAWEAFFKLDPELSFVRDGAGKGADYRER
jgi:mevalonate pyrophosphate decarboxylase